MKLRLFEKVKAFIFQKIEKEAPSHKLYYHSLYHTKEDVLPAARRIAGMEGITDEEDLFYLLTAAAYHDVGCIINLVDHETESAHIAKETLPQFGYTPAQIQRITELIYATRMPQNPETHLERIICDADLDSLGRDDFFMTSLALRLELQHQGQLIGLRDWFTRQLNFLEAHTYFTKSAKKLRQSGKQANIQEIKDLLFPKDT